MPKSTKPKAKAKPKPRIITTAEAFEKRVKQEAFERAESQFCVTLEALCGCEVIKEHRFHSKRQWRFDYAIVELRIALEKQGGLFIQGRHSRGAGYVNDMDKFNEAQLLGWRVFQCQPTELLTKGLETLKKAIKQ